MPKERINSQYHGQTCTYYGADGTPLVKVLDSEPYLHVGWTRGRDHVQVAALAANEGPDADPDASVETEMRGLYVQLGREGINRLIRALRKARDQAYGADA